MFLFFFIFPFIFFEKTIVKNITTKTELCLKNNK